MAPSRVKEEIQVKIAMNAQFDRVFMLTIRRNASKSEATMEHLRSVGLFPELVYGFDGTISGLTTIHPYEIDRPGSDQQIPAWTVNNFIGIAMVLEILSHIGGDSFLILEDDVRFEKDWRSDMAAAMPLPNNWDLIYLGSCCCHGREGITRIKGNLHRVQFALCTHALAVRKKALPALRTACEKVDAAIDVSICIRGIPKLETYAFLPRLASQLNTPLPE